MNETSAPRWKSPPLWTPAAEYLFFQQRSGTEIFPHSGLEAGTLSATTLLKSTVDPTLTNTCSVAIMWPSLPITPSSASSSAHSAWRRCDHSDQRGGFRPCVCALKASPVSDVEEQLDSGTWRRRTHRHVNAPLAACGAMWPVSSLTGHMTNPRRAERTLKKVQYVTVPFKRQHIRQPAAQNQTFLLIPVAASLSDTGLWCLCFLKGPRLFSASHRLFVCLFFFIWWMLGDPASLSAAQSWGHVGIQICQIMP